MASQGTQFFTIFIKFNNRNNFTSMIYTYKIQPMWATCARRHTCCRIHTASWYVFCCMPPYGMYCCTLLLDFIQTCNLDPALRHLSLGQLACELDSQSNSPCSVHSVDVLLCVFLMTWDWHFQFTKSLCVRHNVVTIPGHEDLSCNAHISLTLLYPATTHVTRTNLLPRTNGIMANF